jgi:CheY-like chemotaxis protein
MRKINHACIIEDEPLHVFLTKKHLEISQVINEISVYKNGKDAFENLYLQYKKGIILPELIFLDLNMPIWDGWQFLEEFTKIPIKQKIDIYILTSSINKDDYTKAEEFGLKDHYITKPISGKIINEILS